MTGSSGRSSSNRGATKKSSQRSDSDVNISPEDKRKRKDISLDVEEKPSSPLSKRQEQSDRHEDFDDGNLIPQTSSSRPCKARKSKQDSESFSSHHKRKRKHPCEDDDDDYDEQQRVQRKKKREKKHHKPDFRSSAELEDVQTSDTATESKRSHRSHRRHHHRHHQDVKKQNEGSRSPSVSDQSLQDIGIREPLSPAPIVEERKKSIYQEGHVRQHALTSPNDGISHKALDHQDQRLEKSRKNEERPLLETVNSRETYDNRSRERRQPKVRENDPSPAVDYDILNEEQHSQEKQPPKLHNVEEKISRSRHDDLSRKRARTKSPKSRSKPSDSKRSLGGYSSSATAQDNKNKNNKPISKHPSHQRSSRSHRPGNQGTEKTDERRNSKGKYRSPSISSSLSGSPQPTGLLERTSQLSSVAKSVSTSKKTSGKGSRSPAHSSATSESLLGLVSMLELESISDTEFIHLLPEEIISGRLAKRSMPSSCNRIYEDSTTAVSANVRLAVDMPLGDQTAGLSSSPRSRQELEESAAGKDDPVERMLSKLSTNLQASMLTPESWDDDEVVGVDLTSDSQNPLLNEPDTEEEDDAEDEEIEESIENSLVRLTATSANYADGQKRLLASLSTPWQEINTAEELEEKERQPLQASISRRPVGIETLAATGFSRRYLGEALATKLDKLAVESGESPSSCVVSRHPIALFHRRCAVHNLINSSFEKVLFVPVLPKVPLKEVISSLRCPFFWTAPQETILRKNLIGLTGT